MSWIEIILIGAGLSLDVFAYALCRGAVVGEIDKKSLVILGGGFTKFCGKDTGCFKKCRVCGQ